MSLITINDKKTIINAENILDIKSGKMLTDSSLVIERGYIKTIVRRKEIKGERWKVRVINLPALTLIPGFVESHVHFALNGISFKDSVKDWDNLAFMEKKIKEWLKKYLQNGIFAVRDGGDKAGIGTLAQEISKRDDILAPVVHIPGQIIRRKGFYGSFLGKGLEDLQEIDEIIKKLAQKRVNHIKVLVSGIVSFNHYRKVGSLQFNFSEMKKITETAHKYGLKVMAHASSDNAVKVAVQAGADSVEHGYFMADSTLALMKDKKTFWVPTVVPVYNQTIMPWCKQNNDNQLTIIKKTYNYHLEKLKKAVDAGVNIAAGTDAGAVATPHVQAFFEELQLYKRAGLSNLQILKAATLNGARLMGLDNKIGAIEKGKLPCLIALAGDPLHNLDILKKAEKIIIPKNLNQEINI